ncbi:protein-disulfide reductase DsbD [Oceanicoccus sp. KOV_DT_Chl]|uniref:protein-disulfide reductase DsbD family protein n=1 Tax=Oceanicoccus sp. KOV_DT_Chl TaxID=1904639 RepID=UPI000C7B95D2|nr:protein-disulfide reductase DsbD [Oceanicoccus sp. KOV_DT_Chl]
MYFRLIILAFSLILHSSYSQAQNDFDNNASSSFSTNNFGDDPEFLPVEQAYQLNAEFEADGQLRLNWQIADDYYLYRHGFRFQLSANGQVLTSDAIIPSGLEKEDEYFGRVEVYYQQADIFLPKLPALTNIQLTVTSQGCADAGLCYPPYSQYFKINGQQLSIQETTKPAAIDAGNSQTTTVQPETKTTNWNQLPYMLLLAILGGSILNLMPCVFPVLSLKVLAFANDKQHSPTTHGWSYSAGVIASFVLVAFILVTLQAAGEAIGWGFHLQSPWLVAGLAYLFFVMGLSLSGFVDIGGQWMNAGNELASKQGYSGSFFSGVLATVVASPCTAPFMGTALGFAITQPKSIAVLVFAALGLGMALPVLLLSYSPKLLAKIPKPGIWMEHLKEFLAFPLYITAIWLCWVVGNQTGVNGMATLLLGCSILALAIWLWSGGVIKRTLSAICLATAISLLVSPMLRTQDNSTASTADQSWIAYQPETLAQLRQQGKPVFINITADWCITCLANEKVTLSTQTIQQALQTAGITYLKGDWTNHNPLITDLLKQYGRNGIPLYIMFPAGNASHGTLLPQILTVDIVLDAIAAATPAENS